MAMYENGSQMFGSKLALASSGCASLFFNGHGIRQLANKSLCCMQRWLGTVGRVLLVGCHVRMIENMFMIGCDWLSLVLIVRCMRFLLMFTGVVALGDPEGPCGAP